METHSSTLAWRIPWTESCGTESLNLAGYSPWGHKDWSTLARSSSLEEDLSTPSVFSSFSSLFTSLNTGFPRENRRDPLIHPGQLLEPVTLPGDGMGKDPIHHLQCCQWDSHMLLQKQEKFFPEGKQELLLLQPWRQLKNQLAYGTLYWGGPWLQGGVGYIWALSHFRSIIISMERVLSTIKMLLGMKTGY